MSFRFRILALVALVGVTTAGASAYLTFTQASQQVSASAQADAQTTSQIVNALTDYARQHGTWDGVLATMRHQADQTGQRIKIVAETGEIIADTDILTGHTARPVTTPPMLLDPRPGLKLPLMPRAGWLDTTRAMDATLQAIRQYRSGIQYAACLVQHNIDVTVSPGLNGVPEYKANDNARRTNPEGFTACDAQRHSGSRPVAGDDALVSSCQPQPPARPDQQSTRDGPLGSSAAVVDCLQRAFTTATRDVGPQPVRLYLGADGATRRPLAAQPIIAAAALVALLSLGGTALLGRRVLRPIGAVTAAAHGLGEGNLALRVPAQGRDELAQLARSFNRMADSLQHAEEKQRRLIADITHELCTPLANLRAYLEALKDGVFEPSSDLFANLHQEALLQQRIVDDLQDLALAEAGALAYHRTEVDLTELLETCRAAHQAAADTAGVALDVHTNQPVVIHADPDRLRQVVSNLVTNALHATPRGGSITLTATRHDDGNATVVVRDTGTGIAVKDLPHIFDRLWRADTARARGTGGTGLGLAIAHQIINDHNGHIIAESRLGVGTTITITLPAAR